MNAPVTSEPQQPSLRSETDPILLSLLTSRDVKLNPRHRAPDVQHQQSFTQENKLQVKETEP